MRHSIATVSLSGMLREKLQAAAAAHFDGNARYDIGAGQLAAMRELAFCTTAKPAAASFCTSTSRRSTTASTPR